MLPHWCATSSKWRATYLYDNGRGDLCRSGIELGLHNCFGSGRQSLGTKSAEAIVTAAGRAVFSNQSSSGIPRVSGPNQITTAPTT
jgi:hypothetical protein